MRKKLQRTLAIVMAMLLIAGIMPTSLWTARAKAATAGEGASIVTWSAEDILAAAEGDQGLFLRGEGWSNNNATDDKTFEDGFSAIGANAKADGPKAQAEGKNASGQIPDGGSYVEFKAPANGTWQVYNKVGNNKTFYIVGTDGTKVTKENKTGASIYEIVSAEVKAGETYYAYLGGATAQIWKAVYEASETVWSAEDILAASNGKGALTLRGEGWNTNDATDDKTFEDGFSAIGANAKADGPKAQAEGKNASGQIPDGGSYVEFKAPANGTWQVYNKVGNNKTFYIVGTDGTKVTKENKTGASIYEIVSAEVKAGETYYAYLGGATAQIWKTVYKPVSQEIVEDTPWEQVEAPVINKVTKDEEGNLVVDFSAVIDAHAGAEVVKVTMLYGGFEVETVEMKRVAEVKFTPLWNGDYTFVAVAQRDGAPNKASQEYVYKDYTVPVKKPVIEMAQNRGNGTVYLDWLNSEGADTFELSYRLSGSTDWTVAETANTTGNATLKNLQAGQKYDFQVKATRNSDNYSAVYEQDGFEVTAEAGQQWNFAVVGSAQQTDAVITDESGATVQEVHLSSRDTSADKKGKTEAESIANTKSKLTFQAGDSGKISDGEEGYQYYYTMLNPNTDNFELQATFTINDVSLTPDNQTGFGIIATDMLGVNYYGSQDYVHKYFNSVSTQMYSVKAAFVGQRVITGYFSNDTTSYDGVDRTTEEQRFKNATSSFTNGQTYTFTLKKTDDAFISTCNGEELSYQDLSALSVQEDGSICVGLFASRKVGVEITDIKFTVTDSKGVGEGAGQREVSPSVAILSSNTVNTPVYEYIYYPNIAGKLTVTAPDGTTAFDKNVAAYEVVRVQIPVTEGSNEIKSTLVPDSSQLLTSYNSINKTTNVSYKVLGDVNKVLYVSPDGKSDGAGTKESPLDIQTAVQYAQPGQYIELQNGSYSGADKVTIGRSVCGTEEKPIKLVAEDAGKVIFDKMGLEVIGSYWHIYGIYVDHPNAVGIQICGNYNTIEMCTVEGSGNSGVQISRSGSAENEAGINEMLWPSYNLVKNCESFDNCDAGRNDADGFAAKLTCGEGNVFYGCIGHNNIDDGWDLFAKTISGEIGKVVIDNCVAYDNGWLTTDDISAPGYVFGEGNGFKLGGSYMKGGHVLKNSVSFNNQGKGITSNSCPDNEIYNCTSYGNAIKSGASYNVGLNTKESNLKEWIVEGLISMTSTAFTDKADLIPFALSAENNYIYNGSVSVNNLGQKASDAWFESVDVTKKPTRNEDGTINMNGLLVLTADAPSNSGGRLDVTSDEAKSVKPEAPSAQDPTPDDPSQGTTTPDDPSQGTTTPDDPSQGTTTPDDPSQGTTTPDDPSQGTTTPDTGVDVVTDEDAQGVTGVTPDKDVVLKTESGEVIDTGSVELKSEEASQQQVDSMNQALADKGIILDEGSQVECYDLSLSTKDNKVVKLADGNMVITFKKKADIDYSLYDVIIYHLKDDNTLEQLEAVVTENGIEVKVSSLSPFMIVTVPKAAAENPAQPDNSNKPDGSVQTGDSSNPFAYAAAGLVSLAALGCLYVSSRKRKYVK